MELGRLLRPRSIAVLGGAPAAGVVRRCEELGFAGPIWPVHPHLAEVAGRPAFRGIPDLPEVPDAAFLAVNRDATVAAVRELAALGAGGAVCYASGFKEAGGRGAGLQAELVAAAGAMPLLGPNCYGLINYLDGAALWFDQQGGRRCARGVAIVTQSGNIALNLTMQRRGLPIAYLLTLGNQANVGLARALSALAVDPRVSAIGLHVEGLDDAAAFAAAVRDAGKPLVVLSAGRSERGAALALSHTASLVGRDAVRNALFAHLGVACVASLPELIEALKLLHVAGPLPGRSIVSLSCSGGEAALAADAAASRRLELRPFTAMQSEHVAASLENRVRVTNPLDYHTFVWGRRDRLEAAFTAVLGCGFDMALLILDLPREDRCDPAEWRLTLDAWVAARAATGARVAVLATLPECLPEAVAEELVTAGIVPLAGLEEALAAIEAAADIGAAAAHSPLLSAPAPEGAPVAQDEWAGKCLLAGFGVAHPGGRCVAGPEAAVAAATALGFPLALKAVGPELLHKTELGAVALNLGDAAAVDVAARRLASLGDGLLVEPMVVDGVAELLVGVNREPGLGFCLALGAGGTLVELIAERVLLLLPTTPDVVRAALLGLRVGRLLEGYRGRPAGDLEAAVDAVLAVARCAAAHADRLVEIEVNPLIVRPAGRGAVAADVLVRLVPEG